MELTPRFARLITVLRPRPRLPPVTIATFTFDNAVFSVVIVRFSCMLNCLKHTVDHPNSECRNPLTSCLFLHGQLDLERESELRGSEDAYGLGGSRQTLHRRA